MRNSTSALVIGSVLSLLTTCLRTFCLTWTLYFTSNAPVSLTNLIFHHFRALHGVQDLGEGLYVEKRGSPVRLCQVQDGCRGTQRSNHHEFNVPKQQHVVHRVEAAKTGRLLHYCWSVFCLVQELRFEWIWGEIRRSHRIFGQHNRIGKESGRFSVPHMVQSVLGMSFARGIETSWRNYFVFVSILNAGYFSFSFSHFNWESF